MSRDVERRPSPWNVPNGLTVLRLLLVPVFVVLVVQIGQPSDDGAMRWAAALVFTVASLTDLADGDIARRRGQVTTFGKMVDPIADKALTGAALVGLSWLDEVPWWVTVVVLTREVTVTLLRLWVIDRGVIGASRGGKAKTALLVAAVLLLLLAPLADLLRTVGNVLMAVAVVVTVVTGADYAVRALRLRQSATEAA